MKKKLLMAGGAVIASYLLARAVTNRHSEHEDIDQDNPYIDSLFYAYEGNEEKKIDSTNITAYERAVKPALDHVLSFVGLVVLSPLLAGIGVAIKIDNPGPIFFTQKRVGKDTHYFMLHKFRTMKMDAPHDVPTHMLSDPESYITSVGRVLRRTSLDELPQIWDIFRGKMSVIGPRPALWNQRDLIEVRAEANTAVPGLTGLAQISGRDELEIDVKAGFDREYVKVLRKSSLKGFLMDCKCFIGTIASVLIHDGVVEGGTGSLSAEKKIE